MFVFSLFCKFVAIYVTDRSHPCSPDGLCVNGLHRTGEVDVLDGVVADEGPRRNLAHTATNMDILHVGIGGEGARGNLLHQVGRAVDGDVAIDAVVAVAEGRRAGAPRALELSAPARADFPLGRICNIPNPAEHAGSSDYQSCHTGQDTSFMIARCLPIPQNTYEVRKKTFRIAWRYGKFFVFLHRFFLIK